MTKKTVPRGRSNNRKGVGNSSKGGLLVLPSKPVGAVL
jgi:hypothetical protein